MSGFWQWWQYIPAGLDPYVIEKPLHISWYGTMYLVAFVVSYFIAKHRIRHEGFSYTKEQVQDYMVWAAVGLLVGARIGYVLFYNFSYYASHPLEIILPIRFEEEGMRFTGIAGMSYHGGLIGVIITSFLFFRKRGISFWNFSEFFIPTIPAGYIFGRLGNFINGELYGRPTDVPWGMYFPEDPSGALRHPSQLYESGLEGLFLFLLLWLLRKRSPFEGFLLGIYLIGYGAVRFFVEFFRQPDAQLGTVLGPFSMGQILCFLMIGAGSMILFIRSGNRKST